MGKFFLVAGMITMLMSCGKDIDVFIPREDQGEKGDISHLITLLKNDISPEITYALRVPCGGDAVFEVDKDVVLVVPKNFVDLSVYPCTNGYFDLHVIVCDTKGEIFLAGIHTISEGRLLESRVELNLQIKDGDTPVRLAHGKQISIKVKDPDPRDRMELFYGSEDNKDWIQVDNDPAVWDNVGSGEWIFQQDSTVIAGFGYECFSDSIDWINVDVFVGVPQDQLTEVCVELPAEYSNKNTAVFMVFDDYNSIVHLPGNSDLKQFCENYGASPVGYKVTFVVISDIGDNTFLFESKSTTLTDGHFETLVPVKTPYEEIRNYINDL